MLKIKRSKENYLTCDVNQDLQAQTFFGVSSLVLVVLIQISFYVFKYDAYFMGRIADLLSGLISNFDVYVKNSPNQEKIRNYLAICWLSVIWHVFALIKAGWRRLSILCSNERELSTSSSFMFFIALLIVCLSAIYLPQEIVLSTINIGRGQSVYYLLHNYEWFNAIFFPLISYAFAIFFVFSNFFLVLFVKGLLK